MVWLDAAAYMFQWTGSAEIYFSSLVGRDCGLISPNAVVTVHGQAYWMSPTNFFTYNGSVQPMANVEDVRKWVFDQLDLNYAYQANAVYNPVHNDILFSFTAVGQSNPSVSVLYSIADQCWAPHTFGRASGTHFTQGDTRPIMAGTDGHIYLHESGYDANGVAQPYFLGLGPYALGDGTSLSQVLGVEFDGFQVVGAPSMSLFTYDRLGDLTVEEVETETVVAGTALVDFRVAGRYVGYALADTVLGCYFRAGATTALISPRGTRR